MIIYYLEIIKMALGLSVGWIGQTFQGVIFLILTIFFTSTVIWFRRGSNAVKKHLRKVILEVGSVVAFCIWFLLFVIGLFNANFQKWKTESDLTLINQQEINQLEDKLKNRPTSIIYKMKIVPSDSPEAAKEL